MRAPEFKIAQTVKIAGKGFLNLETHFLTKNWGPAYAVAIASLQYLYLSLPQALFYFIIVIIITYYTALVGFVMVIKYTPLLLLLTYNLLLLFMETVYKEMLSVHYHEEL